MLHGKVFWLKLHLDPKRNFKWHSINLQQVFCDCANGRIARGNWLFCWAGLNIQFIIGEHMEIKAEISRKIRWYYWVLTIGMAAYHGNQLNKYTMRYINKADYHFLDLYVRLTNYVGNLCMVFFVFMSAFWFYSSIHSIEECILKCKKSIKTMFIFLSLI